MLFAFSFILGAWSPATEELQRTSSFWQYVYAYPILILGLQLIFFGYWHTEDSLNFHVINGESDKAMRILEKMYPDQSKFILDLMYSCLDKDLN